MPSYEHAGDGPSGPEASQNSGPDSGRPGGPWGGGPRRPWGVPPRQPPPGAGGPDLDELLRTWRERLRDMLGGGGGGGGDETRRGGRGPRGFGAPLIGGVLFFGWLLTGVYTVDEGEQAVILRFGDFNRVSGPGIHMHLPTPFEARQVINVTGQRTTEIGFITRNNNTVDDNPDESLMITGDRNIVEIHFRVIYSISDVADFAFKVRDPEVAVRAVAESAMREVIGQGDLESIITTGRAEVEQGVEDLMISVLEEYESGVALRQVELLRARAPQAVIAAFNDVVNARQDAETATNNAQRDTARIVNEADAYRQRVISEATGEAQRFLAVYSEYRQAPQVTRDRIYLETMERVYRDGNLIILDQRGGAVPYLPLDSLVRRTPPAAPAEGAR